MKYRLTVQFKEQVYFKNRCASFVGTLRAEERFKTVQTCVKRTQLNRTARLHGHKQGWRSEL